MSQGRTQKVKVVLVAMGLFDSAKGFIKRKDSNDGGEATERLIEELRSSMHNADRTSDGAKRQQDRFCGPVMSMTFNFIVSLGLILTNKLVMNVGFKYPVILTLIHYVTAWVLLAILKAMAWLPVSPPAKATPYAYLFFLGVVMSFASGLANASLKYNSLGIYQMAKIAVTPAIVLAEFILFRRTISYKKVLALVVVSVGVGVSKVTNLESNLFGACIAIIWIIPSAINKILWSHLQQQSNWTALALMWKTTPVTILFLGAMIPLLDPPDMEKFNWNIHNSFAIALSAIFAFLLQWSGALALGATSATAHVVLGQFKSCVLIIAGHLIFNENQGFMSICGALAAIAGMSLYTSLSLGEKQNSSSNQFYKQLKPSAKDDSKTSDANTGVDAV